MFGLTIVRNMKRNTKYDRIMLNV